MATITRQVEPDAGPPVPQDPPASELYPRQSRPAWMDPADLGPMPAPAAEPEPLPAKKGGKK
jgi:hypothetical protein